MKWYDNSYDNTKIKKIPYRLLKVNNEIYDSIFERGGKYILSIKCGVATYYRKNKYANFVTDGYKMIYELPAEEQKEIELDLDNLDNFLQENKTIISSIPGSDIFLDADINTEYIAHRELDKSILIKYDNYSLQDFPMNKRNYNEDIVVERLINNTKDPIGYKKEDKYYFDITESRDYIKVIKNGTIINNELKTDGDSIELPSELGTNIAWNIEQGTDIVMENTAEGESLKLIEIWGNTNQGLADCVTHKQIIDAILSTGLDNDARLNTDNTFTVSNWGFSSSTNWNEINKQKFIQLEPNTEYSICCWRDNGAYPGFTYTLYEETRIIGCTGATNSTFSTGPSGKVLLYPGSAQGGKLKVRVVKGKHDLTKYPYEYNLSDIRHVGELYVNSRGRSILNKEGNEQYKIEIETSNTKNLLNEESHIPYKLPSNNINNLENSTYDGFFRDLIEIKKNKVFSYAISDYDDVWMSVWTFDKNGNVLRREINNQIVRPGKVYSVTFTNNEAYFTLKVASGAVVSGIKIQVNEGEHIFPYSKYKTYENDTETILLPCQLMKVGDIADKLYWDEENNKYIVEKNIGFVNIPINKIIKGQETSNIIYFNTKVNLLEGAKNITNRYSNFINSLTPKGPVSDNGQGCAFSSLHNALQFSVFKSRLADNSINGLKELMPDGIDIYYERWSKLIETTILEQKTLNCYNDRTYVTINNTSLSPIMKVKAPINANTSNQILLSRENNFDSILDVTLEPNKNTNITFFEGGLDLKLTSGIEILSTGEVRISNKDECYASKDFIDLASYTSSTFTIDTMDILFEVNSNKFTIYYYNKDKKFINKALVPFGDKFYKSNIQYPSDTQYCKIAFINKSNIKSDYAKIRILRDKTKTNGFETINKTFENTDGYTKSFSEYLPIKNDIERLVFFTDNYDSISEFSIINNFDSNKKKHTYPIPKKLEPGETLSYNRSRNKQFVYKSNNTPYNHITNVGYDYSKNLANGIRFVLGAWITNAGVYQSNVSTQHCSTEKYIDVSQYKEHTLTVSAALLIAETKICLYRENKTHMQNITSQKNFITFTVPAECCYIRIECYMPTLASQSNETKELIQKHVMVTTTDYRCDWAPSSILIIPEKTNNHHYKLNLNNNNRYLFIKPYKFDYRLLNNFNNFDGKWTYILHQSTAVSSDGYATLESIKGKPPISSSTIKTPVGGISHRVFEYTKYIYSNKDFVFNATITPDEKCIIYINDREIVRYSDYGTYNAKLTFTKGVSKLTLLIVNDSGGGGLWNFTDIPLMSHSSEFDLPEVLLEDKFNIENIFFHNIIDGKLLTAKEDLNLRLESESKNKFIFAKDFVRNSEQVINGYIDTNVIQTDNDSRTYINRVDGGETNFTLLTVGGNICEIYFSNNDEIKADSSYVLHAKYDSGHQKIKIDKIPDTAKYIAIVTDKQNEGTKCSNIFLFPGEIKKKSDVTYEDFQMFDDFNQEIATLSYSSEIVISKNKMPDLSKLILDSSKYSYEENNKRFVFPIKIKKESDVYYFQYWTEAPNQSLDIFIDSTEDISDSRQYLCQHTVETVNNKYIQIHNDILDSLIDDTLYISVTLNNSNKSDILKFLVGGTYKFQLEQDAITQEYEPYKETVKHCPMYLTANGLTIESTSSYYGIRTLIAPQNIVSISNNGLTRITWDEVIGASHYILYLEKEEYQIVDTNVFETKKEIKGLMSVKAKNSITESEFSKDIYVHSVPTNPFILHIENKYEDEKYKFYVYFRDDSNIEESFNLRYSIDGRQEQVTKLPAVENIGETSEAYFTVADIRENVAVRITAINDSGENEVASQFILKLMPDFVWTYNEDNNRIVMAWDNKYPECSDYVVRYKKKDDEVAKTFKITNNYREGERITYSIDLEPEDVMEVSISALKDEIYYIFTKPKTVSKDLDVTKTPPSHFTSIKPQNDTIEFSWFDNSIVETGWELVYSINNGSPQTITIPTKSQTTNYQLYKYPYKFDKHGYMTAKLRTIWELGASKFTESIINYYYPIDNKPPQGLTKRYESRTSILITWDPPQYFESYELVITKGEGDDQVTETIKTKDNRYIINLNDQVIEKYRVKVKTNFLGDQQSDYTKELVFTPTFSDNKILTTINTKCREEYVDIRKLIADRISDEFNVVTRSTSKVSWSFPLVTATLSRFQTYEGLISMETWNTGQRTEYTDTMIVKTEAVNMHEAILNTISYQKTKCEGYIEGFIYTPSTISGKIVMEINKTRIVCIGDSITAGHPGFWAESMTGEITHQYPYWLDRRLKFQYEVINKGYGSDRTFNVLNRFQKDVLDLSPQYCLMQIGTNDIYWGGASADGSIEAFDSSTLADMKKNVMAMVELCFQNDIVPIIGMLIPRTQVVTDPVVKHGLYKFNEWIIEYANSTEGLNYVDFFNAGKDKIPATPLEDPKSPGAMNPIYDGDNVYDEMGNLVKYGAGIHLNAAGYRIMAEAIPLNLFTTIQSGVKMYMDEKCTIEAEYNTDDKQNPFYEIEIEGMKLTRTKKIVRYIKNIGNTQVLFSIYPNDLHNLDYNFKFKDTDEGTKTISGILTPGNSRAIKMELTPLTEDSKSSIELSLVSREFSIETK